MIACKDSKKKDSTIIPVSEVANKPANSFFDMLFII